jgi:hypothetical protein
MCHLTIWDEISAIISNRSQWLGEDKPIEKYLVDALIYDVIVTGTIKALTRASIQSTKQRKAAPSSAPNKITNSMLF